MPRADTTAHSFIVKIWLEETGQEANSMLWRGRITHVPGGENRYFQELNDIGNFIFPYLQAALADKSAEGARTKVDYEP